MTAIVMAERAALGALLLGRDADNNHAVVRWLRPGDFFDPWHREVYRAIRDRIVAAEPVDAHTVGLGLLDRLGPNRADVVRLGALLRATPAQPDPPRYARMVLEAALRREIAGLGVLLRAGALVAVLEGNPRPLAGVAAAVDANIDAADFRWKTANAGPTPGGSPRIAAGTEPRPIGLHPGPDGLPGPRRVRGADAAEGAGRLLHVHPMPTPVEVADREAALVAALIADPAALGSVRSWLRPDAVTNDAWRPVYAAMLRLADRGTPVDTVTVCWEASRRSQDRPVADALQVSARVDASLGEQPGFLASAVAADHLRVRAHGAAIAIHTAADDYGRELWQVVSAARNAVAAVRTAAAPLGVDVDVRPSITATRAVVTRVPNRSLEAG